MTRHAKSLNVNGRYTVNASDRIDLSAETIRITGNLVVEGTRTEVNSVDSFIFDNIVTLNKGETSAGVAVAKGGLAGLEVDRGTLDKAVLRWNEVIQQWELGVGSLVAPILTTAAGGAFLTKVEDDAAPRLGGDLDVANKTIFSDTNTNLTIEAASGQYIALNSPLLVKDSLAENPASNSTAIYANPSTGGGTGLYTSRNSVSEELVSKRKAIAFSIIF